ncbi:cytochrome b560 subunit of succinate dehydrogenase [Coniochaeta sp. PMI_546]|nr:cytochrome b560 subunit of succinate dehydrogenase [Coniochaeta sp. PMI_546]
MIAQRLGTTALRRVTATPQNAFFTQNLARLALTSSLSTTQSRAVATQKLTQEDARAILDAQRLKRPVSPHLEIYDKKQTFFTASIWQRFTGAGFTGLLYGYSIAYLAAPLIGWHLESASLVAAFAGLPVAVKAGAKFLVAWPFVFHAINGVRHAAYDMAWGFDKKSIIKGGWYIWGASIVASLGLLLL